MQVRPDPKRIAELIGLDDDRPRAAAPAAPLRRDPRAPGRAAGDARRARRSFGVMVSVMNLSGYVVVEHHHHGQGAVFPIIGAHVLGMYALVLVVGGLIDRIGRTPALAVGLVVMALSTIGLLWVESVVGTAILLFGLGIGWNVSFVAATAQLVDLTTPVRARQAARLQRPPVGAARRGAVRCSAASRSTRSASPRWRSAPPRSSPRRCCGCCRWCAGPHWDALSRRVDCLGGDPARAQSVAGPRTRQRPRHAARDADASGSGARRARRPDHPRTRLVPAGQSVARSSVAPTAVASQRRKEHRDDQP